MGLREWTAEGARRAPEGLGALNKSTSPPPSGPRTLGLPDMPLRPDDVERPRALTAVRPSAKPGRSPTSSVRRWTSRKRRRTIAPPPPPPKATTPDPKVAANPTDGAQEDRA